MVITVQEFLTDAMAIIGAVDIDETPSSSNLNMVKRAANKMIDGLSVQRLLLRSTDTVNFTATGGKYEYSIGPSSSNPDIITTGKPLRLQSATLTDSGAVYALEVKTKDQYDALEDRLLSSSRPIYIAYDPDKAQQSAQLGYIYLYNIPDKSYSISLEVDSYLNEFNNFSDTVNFEPAYYEMLTYNLAVRIFRLFHPPTAQIPADVVAIANNSISTLKSLNSEPIYSAMDIPSAVKNYNIFTDGYN